jgi:hypothetical protein
MTVNDTVILHDWQPFYVYPVVPTWMDYKVGDKLEIRVWRMEGNTRIPYAYPGDANATYKQQRYLRDESDPYWTRFNKPGQPRWMMFFVCPGYVGILPGRFLWTVTNLRTNVEWSLYVLDQLGKTKAPPLPPTLGIGAWV